jgi:hypothetical protein
MTNLISKLKIFNSINKIAIFFFLLFMISPAVLWGQKLYQLPPHADTRWVSFENPSGEKGNAGKENKQAKGHAWDNIEPGESKIIFDVSNPGIIKRIWLTVSDRSPVMLRSLRIDMYWDNADKPAVSAPLGDFFGVGLGKMVSFQNALFANPEGRSFECYISMPFRKNAKIVITNESNKQETLFYDIDYLKLEKLPKGSLYFHAYWSDNSKTTLGEDFAILPKIKGRGRFLGANFGIITDTSYGNSWWGEGEVKIYLDGDSTYPTLAGTGTEDYLGSGWGLGTFANQFTGCLIADPKNREWVFYRYHIPDPVYFHENIKVTIQQIGGGQLKGVRKIAKQGAPLIPVSVTASDYSKQWNLLDMVSPPKLTDTDFPLGWVNFYRKDNYSATVYFYLNKPESNLPPLAPVAERIKGISQ